jgi:hypothetical protein
MILDVTTNFDVISENMKMVYGDLAAIYQNLSSVHGLLKLCLLVERAIFAGALAPRNRAASAHKVCSADPKGSATRKSVYTFLKWLL